jgi:hypothetical protein
MTITTNATMTAQDRYFHSTWLRLLTEADRPTMVLALSSTPPMAYVTKPTHTHTNGNLNMHSTTDINEQKEECAGAREAVTHMKSSMNIVLIAHNVSMFTHRHVDPKQRHRHSDPRPAEATRGESKPTM